VTLRGYIARYSSHSSLAAEYNRTKNIQSSRS